MTFPEAGRERCLGIDGQGLSHAPPWVGCFSAHHRTGLWEPHRVTFPEAGRERCLGIGGQG